MRFKFFFPLCLLPIILFAEIGYVEPWNADSHIEITTPPKTTKLSPMGLFAEKAILFHQSVLTHISGPRSNYRPSSSGYMLEAIREYGFVKGYIMGCDRLLRENPDPWVYRSTVYDKKLYKWDPPLPLEKTNETI